MGSLTPTETGAWRGFLRFHTQVWHALEEAMLKRCGLNLAAYELLLSVEEAGEDAIRMTELAQTLHYTSGGLTRLVDRLQQLGLIQRMRCETDGRGFQVHLTPQGKQQLKRIHVEHLHDVRQMFLNRLSDEEQTQLGTLWNKLLNETT